jgi:uncharacterized membrane protein
MADFKASVTVHAAEGALFDYLADVANLPRYFVRMTSATPGDGEEVHTAARLPDGQEVAGDAWFRTDPAAGRIEWGSEGPNSYHGSLEITDAAGNADVELRVHTTRVADGDSEVQQGVDETLANIKRLVERHSTS